MLEQVARLVLAAFEALDAGAFRVLATYAARKSALEGQANLIHFFVGSLGLGGTQRQLAVLVRFLGERSYRCKVWVLEEMNEFLPAIEECGATVECLFPSRAPRVPVVFRRLGGALRNRSHVWTALVLARRLRRERPAVLQCLLNTTNVSGALAGRMAGVPVVVAGLRSLHPEEPRHPPAGAFQRGCYRLLNPRLVDALVANSESGLASFLKYQPRFPKAKARVVRNGMGPATPVGQGATGASLRELGPRAEAPLILWAGRLAPEKRVDVLIHALHALSESGREFRAIVVGEGRTKSEGVALATTLGIGGQVAFLGFRRDLPELLSRARVAVLTSDIEGLPNILVEAHVAGCPVVATRAGGTGEVVDEGRTGFLAPCGDAAAIAAGLARLIDDPELAASMGTAARERVQRVFSAGRMGQETLTLYQQIAGAKGHSVCPGPRPAPPRSSPPNRDPVQLRRLAHGVVRRAKRALDHSLLASLAVVALVTRFMLFRSRRDRDHEDSRLRLLFFIPQLGMGGAQRALVNLLNHIDPRKYAVELCARPTRGNFFGDLIRHQGLAFTELSEGANSLSWKHIRALTARIGKARPDVVIGWMHWATIATALAGSLARAPQILVSFQNMSPLFRNPRPSQSSRFLDIVTGVLADTLPCSHACATSYVNWARFRESHIHVLPNSCEVAATNALAEPEIIERRRDLGLPPGPLVGYVGRLAAGKGVEAFLETVYLAARLVPNLSAIVVGDGPKRDEVIGTASRVLKNAGGLAFGMV
ncbi:MAG TPA: glycosyltransferase [Anaeromyxobacteraceae bacterium]|nr:glycosyltransferase [Anaeromyxobacteraceae bacterium]